MKNKIKKMIISFFSLFKVKNVIILESVPDYTDSSKMFFDYLIKTKLNEKYKIYWFVNNKEKLSKINYKNVSFIKVWDNKNKVSFINNLKMVHYSRKAKYIFTCNRDIRKYNKKTISVYFSHSIPLKYIKNIKMVSPSVDYVISPSKYFENIYVDQFNVTKDKVLPLGLPRYDAIFNKKCPKKKLSFIDKKYQNIFLWLPTYRQHKNQVHNDISKPLPFGLPIIYSDDDLKKMDNYLKKNDALLLLKMHPAQDISKIKKLNTKNIKFITDDDLFNNDIILSELLFYTKALITDYSGVLYDAIAMDKSIIYTTDDFEDYKKTRGFMDDNPFNYMVGYKVNNLKEMIKAMDDVINNNDKYNTERREKMHTFFDYQDDLSSKRIVDYFKM
mgnify:FL=1